MQLYNITYLAFAAMALSTGVEARGFRGGFRSGGGRAGGASGASGAGGGRGGRFAKGAGKAGEHAGDAIGIGSDIAGFVPGSGVHYQHNCCRNNGPSGGGWIFDAWATALTKTACGTFPTAQLINGVCTEAQGQVISGNDFMNACRATVPGDNNVGAGYRGEC